jgi:hypothetical protein
MSNELKKSIRDRVDEVIRKKAYMKDCTDWTGYVLCLPHHEAKILFDKALFIYDKLGMKSYYDILLERKKGIWTKVTDG